MKEHIRHWRIGDVDVARIVEVYGFEDNISMLLKDETAEFVRQFAWLRPHFATPEGLMKISFQAFVLRSRGKHVMIDTCIGADRKREYEVFCNIKTTFLQDLAAAGFPPETIDTVLCTHLHFDHVGWNTMLVNGQWLPTFPNARYLFGRVEYEHWSTQSERADMLPVFADSIRPIFERGLADLIEWDHQICPEIGLMPSTGHTPGHASIRISSNRRRGMITGDFA